MISLLVALTPDAVNSEWVGNEIAYANNAQKTIIPLHLKKCDIPIGLIKKQYIDFENQTQKIAIKELLGSIEIQRNVGAVAKHPRPIAWIHEHGARRPHPYTPL